MPSFGGFSADMDAEAVKVLQKVYGPDREVVTVFSREVLLNGGNVHSITQQNPATSGKAPIKAAPKQPAPTKPASGGFFDSVVGSEWASRSGAPAKAAPKKPASTSAASGMFLAVMDSK